MRDLKEAKLSTKEKEALDKSLRRSKIKPIKTKLSDQVPPYVLLPLLAYIPGEWIVWDATATTFGFLGEALRVLNGNIVMESGLALDGTDYLKIPPRMTAQMVIANPPESDKFDWIERAYDNQQAFALLLTFDTWAEARAQTQFQRFGVSTIILNRPVRGENVAWFTWGLPFVKQQVTYGQLPSDKFLPEWLVRPNQKKEITKGGTSMKDKFAIRHATNPVMWPKEALTTH